MFRLRHFNIIILAGIILLSSCSGYQKLLKSSNSEKKYEMALHYYNEGDYFKAMQLFDALIPVYRGTDKAELLYYYNAYSYYKQSQYILASYYFKRFARSFPKSKYAEECQYLSAYCKYLDSPKYNLDQTNTYEAINELQLFIDVYPESERVAQCNELIDQLRGKLEKKAFEISKLYLKMDYFKAAITSFEIMLKDYPDTEYREQILFLTTQSYYEYAQNSIGSRQNERYQNTLDACESFISAYPESTYLKEANNIYKNTLKELHN